MRPEYIHTDSVKDREEECSSAASHKPVPTDVRYTFNIYRRMQGNILFSFVSETHVFQLRTQNPFLTMTNLYFVINQKTCIKVNLILEN